MTLNIKLFDRIVHVLVFSDAMKVTGRIHRTCENPTPAEGCARAWRIAPATLSHRASRPSPWPGRRAIGRVPIRPVRPIQLVAGLTP